MHFLPDVWVECDACRGARYNPETLAVKYHGKIDRRRARHAGRRGAGAVRQHPEDPPRPADARTTSASATWRSARPAPTLSGGEAQRVKLAAELARPDTGQDALPPRRADDRPALRRHPQAARRAPPPGRPGQHGHRRRAQPRRDQDGRLGHRPRPRGGRRRRPGRRGGHPRGRSPRPPGSLHRRDPQGRPRRRPARRAAEVRPQGRREEDHRRGPGRVRRRARPTPRSPPGRSTAAAGTPATASAGAARPARWEGRILERIVDRIHELGEFAPTDWSQRAVVKIAGPEPGDSPFFQASTGNEWVVTLRFLVPRNTFKKATLAASLALTPFHESPTPVLCDLDRLCVANGKGGHPGDHDHLPRRRRRRDPRVRSLPGPRRRLVPAVGQDRRPGRRERAPLSSMRALPVVGRTTSTKPSSRGPDGSGCPSSFPRGHR